MNKEYAEKLSILKEQSLESTKRLADIAKEYKELRNKEDSESRIKKLELFTSSIFHGWVIETAKTTETTYEVCDTLNIIASSIFTLHKKIEKLGNKDVAFDQEISNMREKVANTLIPIQKKIEEDQKIFERGNDIYG